MLEPIAGAVDKTLAFIRLKFCLNEIEKSCLANGENQTFEKAKSLAPDLIDAAIDRHERMINYFYSHWKSMEENKEQWELFLKNYVLPYFLARREICDAIKKK